MSLTKTLILLSGAAILSAPLMADVIDTTIPLDWSSLQNGAVSDSNDPFSPANWSDQTGWSPIVGSGNAIFLSSQTFDPYALDTSWLQSVFDSQALGAPAYVTATGDASQTPVSDGSQPATAGTSQTPTSDTFQPATGNPLQTVSLDSPSTSSDLSTPEPGTFGGGLVALALLLSTCRSIPSAIGRRFGRRVG
jgi:hypothetical protein